MFQRLTSFTFGPMLMVAMFVFLTIANYTLFRTAVIDHSIASVVWALVTCVQILAFVFFLAVRDDRRWMIVLAYTLTTAIIMGFEHNANILTGTDIALELLIVAVMWCAVFFTVSLDVTFRKIDKADTAETIEAVQEIQAIDKTNAVSSAPSTPS